MEVTDTRNREDRKLTPVFEIELSAPNVAYAEAAMCRTEDDIPLNADPDTVREIKRLSPVILNGADSNFTVLTIWMQTTRGTRYRSPEALRTPTPPARNAA